MKPSPSTVWTLTASGAVAGFRAERPFEHAELRSKTLAETVIVEVPNPGHPYGAKGAAEVNICPPMAAIANAIERATGQRLTELPLLPPKLPAAIEAREQN